MANYYNINRSVEAYEFRTIDPNNGQLRNILDIAGSGGGGGGSVDLSDYYTKAQTNNLFTPYYDSSEVDVLLTSYYDKTETDNLFTPYYTKTETDGLFTPYYTKTETDNLFTPYYTKTETDNLFTPYYTKTEVDTSLSNKLNVSNPEITGILKGNEFDSKNNLSNIQFKHTNTIYLEYDYDYDTNGGLVLGKPLALASSLDIPLNSKLLFQHTDSYINETLNSGNFLNFVMKEQTGQIDFYVGDPANASNLVMILQNNLITFHKTTSPAIGGGGVDDTNLVKYTGETLQTIDGDVVIGGGAQFSNYDFTVNGSAYFNSIVELALGGSLNLGNNKGYIRSLNLGGGNHAYDHANFSSGGLHRFYVGGSPFPQYLRFQLSSSQAYFNVEAICPELQTNIINTKDAGNTDLTFKRNDIDIFKFNTSNQIQLLGGNGTSYIYEDAYFDLVNYNVLRIRNTETVDNSIISFGVGNTLDVFQIFSSGITSSVELSIPQVLCNAYDSFGGDNDVVFSRNGQEYMKLQGSNSIVNIGTGVALSSNYLYCNYISQRTLGNDMVFRGGNVAGDSPVEYMKYRRTDEDLNFLKDVYITQDKKAYFHRETGKSNYIYSHNTAGVNHLRVFSEDPNGDIRFTAGGGNVRMFITPTKVSVPSPYTLEGDLVDTSDSTKKYDIKSIEYNFTDIVKQIEPKTFKMNDEKDIGITKNHLGFIADEIVDVIPPEWENIVMVDNEGIKKLSYIKLTGILWGVYREQQQKIEHLESRLFEVENFIKDFVKPKPKAKSKSKN